MAMMGGMSTPTVKQAAELLGQLSPDDVAKRIDEIRAEERALKTLLRALRARQRRQKCGDAADA